MEKCTVFVKCIEGIDNMELRSIPLDTSITELKKKINENLPPSIIKRTSISSAGGININPYKTINDLYTSTSSNQKGNGPKFLNLQINICLCGGKGGFGQLLKARAHSGKKSKKRKDVRSNDLYKTLDGRRVKSLRRLKQLENYMETLEDDQRIKLEEKKTKLQKILDIDLEKNVKYDDNEFLNEIEKQIEEIRDSVKLESFNESESEDERFSDNDSDLDSSSDISEDESGKNSGNGSSRSLPKFQSFFDDDEGNDSTNDKDIEISKTDRLKNKGKDIEQ